MHISFNQIFSNLQFQAVKNKVLQTLTHASVQQKVIAAVTAVFTLALVTFAVVRCLRNRKATKFETTELLPTNKVVVTDAMGKIVELQNPKEVKDKEVKDKEVKNKEDKEVKNKEVKADDEVESESKVKTEVPVSKREQLKKEREENKAARAKAEAEKVNSMAIIVHPNFPLTQAPKAEVNKDVTAHAKLLQDEFVRSLLSPKLSPVLFVPPVAPVVQAAPQAKVEAPLNDAVIKLEEKLVVEEEIAPATPVRLSVLRKEDLVGLSPMAQQIKIHGVFKENCRLILNAEKAEKAKKIEKQVDLQPVQPTSQQGFFSKLIFGARATPVGT